MFTADKVNKILNKTDLIKSVLVIEDDEGLNRLIQKKLIKSGFTVDGFFNGRDVIAHLRENQDILLLLDLVLPDISGREVIEEITRQHLEVHFIVMTGHGDEKIAVEMMKMGARDYLIKDSDFLEHLVPKVQRICNDINIEKRLANAEKSLISAAQEWQVTFDAIKDAVALLDPDSKIIRCNEAMQRLLDKPLEEIVGHTCCQLMHGHSGPIVDCPYQRSIKSKQKETQVLSVNERFLDATVYPVLDNDGILSGAVHIVADITESKQAEEELRTSEIKYRSMMESLTDGLYICSPESTIEYMNSAMIKRLGRDATGEICHKAIHGLDHQCDWCVFNKVANGETVETTITSPLDSRTYSVTHTPIHNSNGTVSKMSIFRDITPYLEAVAEKNKTQIELRQAQKMESIGTLAGGIAHDFNNILSAIIGFSELALDGVDKGTELEDDLKEVHKAGMRAKDLVKQILTFARQSDEELRPIQVNIIVKEVLKFIKSSIPTNIQIQDGINSDSFIMGSPTHIHQILMNLCTNSSQAMEEDGGILEVNLSDVVIDKMAMGENLGLLNGDYIEIKVSDTGIGIPSRNIHTIFEPYFTTKKTGEGTGMGLSVVHGIVESYGGKITVASTMGKGTVFTIFLPISKKRIKYDSFEEEVLPGGKEHILFVDDEAPISKMGSRVLERLGYTVTSRTSSVEALELFRSKPKAFDLVITDMTMPNITGDKLAVELIKIRPDIPVVLCTGFSKRISEKSGSEIGIRAFLNKPILKSDMAKAVRRVLDEAKPENQG